METPAHVFDADPVHVVYVESVGRLFRVTAICTCTDDANRHTALTDDAVMTCEGPYVFMVKKNDCGRPIAGGATIATDQAREALAASRDAPSTSTTKLEELREAGSLFSARMADQVGSVNEFYQGAMQSDIEAFETALAASRDAPSTPTMRAALDRLARAVANREDTMGDQCILIEFRAELRSATAEVRGVLAASGGA